MHKNSRVWHHRAIVTETLPYEVPVIFSNDKFFSALTLRGSKNDTQNILDRIYQKAKIFTIPYNYSIRKEGNRSTKLSIIHPRWQMAISDFYRTHEGSLLSHCAKGPFSLRRPVATASRYDETASDSAPSALKTGTVASTDQEDSDASSFISYFVYEPFNLLGKFYESHQFIELERRFKFLRTLDVSKCFYHIYTHTVGWAVKDKAFAKKHASAYSFESEFDRLMQKSNYNETNGIVVGPEISRIFAEIILQRVDIEIELALAGQNLRHQKDYAIRRYVDDYAIFASSTKTLDVIERIISDKLADIKLYLNEKKIATYERPFITPITLAKSDLGTIIKNLERILFDEKNVRYAAVRDTLRDVRANVVKYGIDFGNVSGWLMFTLNRLALRANSRLGDAPKRDDIKTWFRVANAILTLCFHICSLDLRVRTTYSTCQLINSLHKVQLSLPSEEFEEMQHRIGEEILSLISDQQNSEANGESIESYNILLTGVFFLGSLFAKHRTAREYFLALLDSDLTYFKFITLTFCFKSDASFFAAEIDRLNHKATERLTSPEEIKRDSETFLLFCDYLSSPLVPDKLKRQVLQSFVGGNPSSATLAELSSMVGFVEWEKINVDHLLRRKELRPVYAMA